MIVPATVAVGGGSGAGGAAFRVGGAAPLPRDFVPSVGSGLSPELDILIGPLTPMGATNYDTLHAAKSAAFEVLDPYLETDYNYYDRCLAMYMMYYRTGVEHWRTTAREIGFNWSHEPNPSGYSFIPDGRNGMPAVGNGSLLPPIRWFGSLGLAVYYLDTGDTLARDVVGYQWLWAQWLVYSFDRQNSGARESAYALMTYCAAHLLGFTTPSALGQTPAQAAAIMVDTFIDAQSIDLTDGTHFSPFPPFNPYPAGPAGYPAQPNDAWQDYQASGAYVPALYFIQNFQQGLVTEALIMYDRVFPGDARVLAAIKLCADWLWATQWVPLAGGLEVAYEFSSSSVALGTGTKTFTVSAGLGWNSPGAPIAAYSRTAYPDNEFNPSEYMIGTVTSYSGATLVINVLEMQGPSATRSAWDIKPFGYPLDQSTTGSGCFQYANIHSGTINKASDRNYQCLTGLMLPAMGYLYSKGQGSSYKTNGDVMVASMQSAVYFLTKQYTEAFRSSPRYLGWTA